MIVVPDAEDRRPGKARVRALPVVLVVLDQQKCVLAEHFSTTRRVDEPHAERPEPLIARDMVVGLRERMDCFGAEIIPLSKEEIRDRETEKSKECNNVIAWLVLVRCRVNANWYGK